jgi:hypothetical protein
VGLRTVVGIATCKAELSRGRMHGRFLWSAANRRTSPVTGDQGGIREQAGPMRDLEDRRLCPHCGGELCQHPYLMARQAEGNVLSLRFIAWVIALVTLLVALTS